MFLFSGKNFFYKTAAALAVLTMMGCTSSADSVSTTTKSELQDRGDYYVDNTIASQNHDSRVKFLIMHYTVDNEEKALEHLTKGAVSSHYLVSQQPKKSHGKPVITQLVPEERRAWHAGISNWQNRTNLNDSSIGIEIVNTGFTDNNGVRTWYPYTDEQIKAVALLAKDIIQRHEIKPQYVLGHSDIAPARKQDPGKLFPWQKLAEQGIGAWPDEATVTKYLAGRSPAAAGNMLTIQQTLKKYGYDTIPQTGVSDEATRTVISAFQMHFRPSDISGRADAETEAIAKALVEKYVTKS